MSSLASILNSIQTQEEEAPNEQGLDEVHKAAKLFYASLLNPTSQRGAHDLFKHLDKNKDGRVAKEELSQLLKGSRVSPHLDYLFGMLDTDKNGELSFEECITLYYLMQTRPECDHCGVPLVGLFYTCVSCWDCKNEAYNLCYKCYRSKNYRHAHQEFLDNYLAFRRLLSLKVKSNKIQCSVCGDIHDGNIPSFFPDGQHIVKRDDDCGYICEWCLRRTCSSCGTIFNSLQNDARPRQWLMNNFYCKGCGKPGNITDKSAIIEKFKSRCFDGSIPQCENCYFKIRNDELLFTPRIQKQLSTSISSKVAVAPDNKINNGSNSVASPSNIGLGGFGDIIHIAQMAFTVVQASKSQPSQEVLQAPQCKMM